MKVAINKCYGGFGISTEALKELVKMKSDCVESYTPKHYYGGDNKKSPRNDWEKRWVDDLRDYVPIGDGFLSHRLGFNIFYNFLLWDLKDKHNDNFRANKDLISVIELLGDKANASLAKITIVEIPDDIEWHIEDYDGVESIRENHRSW